MLNAHFDFFFQEFLVIEFLYLNINYKIGYHTNICQLVDILYILFKLHILVIFYDNFYGNFKKEELATWY